MGIGSRARSRCLVLSASVLALGACASTDTSSPTSTGGSSRDYRESPKTDTSSREPLPSLETIYFDFDRYEIRADAESALRSNAKAIRKNKSWGTITIEGYCDERGSEEYNLALGERRARSVKTYLSDLGVRTSRLDVVSFGEAKPAVMGHDESAWRYNRRSEFKASQ